MKLAAAIAFATLIYSVLVADVVTLTSQRAISAMFAQIAEVT